MTRKIRTSDITDEKNKIRDNVVVRDIEWFEGQRRMGRSTIKAECPFCKTDIEAYTWSISGCGKRCPGCNAMTSSHGSAYQFKDQVEAIEAESKRLADLRRGNKKARKKVRKPHGKTT